VLTLLTNAGLVLYLFWGSHSPVNDSRETSVESEGWRRGANGHTIPFAQHRPTGNVHPELSPDYSGELGSLYAIAKAAAGTHRQFDTNSGAQGAAVGTFKAAVTDVPPAPAPLRRLGSPVAHVAEAIAARGIAAVPHGAPEITTSSRMSSSSSSTTVPPRHMLYPSWQAWTDAGSPHGDMRGGAAVLSKGKDQVHHLPYFSVVGAQKAGTTYLRFILVQHPQLASGDGLHGEANGEPHFFDWGYPGAQSSSTAAVATKYAAMFHSSTAKFNRQELADSSSVSFGSSQGVIGSGGNTLYFDTTPAYLVELKTVPARMHRLVPHIKLVAIVRDPTDRYRSEFQMEVCRARFNAISDIYHQHGAMAQYLREPVAAKFKPLWRGLYLDQFQAWLNLWPREALLVLTSDELYAAPANATARVLNFLKLDPSPSNFNGFNFKASKNAACKKDMTPFLDASELAQLREFYHKKNQGLSELLGVTFSWLKSP